MNSIKTKINAFITHSDKIAFALSISLLLFFIIGTTIQIVQYTNQYSVKFQNFINIEPKVQQTYLVKK